MTHRSPMSLLLAAAFLIALFSVGNLTGSPAFGQDECTAADRCATLREELKENRQEARGLKREMRELRRQLRELPDDSPEREEIRDQIRRLREKARHLRRDSRPLRQDLRENCRGCFGDRAPAGR